MTGRRFGKPVSASVLARYSARLALRADSARAWLVRLYDRPDSAKTSRAVSTALKEKKFATTSGDRSSALEGSRTVWHTMNAAAATVMKNHLHAA